MQKEQQAAPMELELFTYLFSKTAGSSGAFNKKGFDTNYQTLNLTRIRYASGQNDCNLFLK